MDSYYDHAGITLYKGGALDTLRRLPDQIIQTCVTSPPYWRLRDYGHPEQLGMETTLTEYIFKVVKIFREIKRLLKNDGTLWLNMGDSYATGGRGGGGAFMDKRKTGAWKKQSKATGWKSAPEGLKHKDLVGIPWRVAFALQADGWYLRKDIIWSKPNALPESVRDRPTTAHEYIFLMSKKSKYYYDVDAIREPVTGNAHSRGNGVNPKADKGVGWGYTGSPGRDKKPRTKTSKDKWWKVKQNPSFSAAVKDLVDVRNKRSVWTVPTKPFLDAHFSTFPPDLIKPCILAGSAPGDVVLDPFVGSGTTVEVAKEFNRKAIGVELVSKSIDMAVKRLRQEVLSLQVSNASL